jgi:hypothetical protein
MFYKCTENLSNVTFTEAEMHLLNKGLKCNLHYKHKDWIKTLALESDSAISKLHETDQTYMRQLVANKIQKCINEQRTQKENDRQPKEN